MDPRRRRRGEGTGRGSQKGYMGLNQQSRGNDSIIKVKKKEKMDKIE